MSNWLTVNDLYKYTKENNLKLLSNYNADFWQEYLSNYKRYDKLFNRMYASFRYFYQDGETVANLATDFTDEVYNHLLVNNKKYEELYRVNVLGDSDYAITGDIDYTETMSREKNESGTYTNGSRSDTTTTSIGAKTDARETQVAAFNSSSYSNTNKVTDSLGAQSNSESFSKGQEINSTDIDNTDDYTLTKKGKMGDRSASQLLKQHLNLWDDYKFYTYIFNEICAELLLV